MKFLSERFMYSMVIIDSAHILECAISFFSKHRKNLVTKKMDNVMKKYGLMWNYRNFPNKGDKVYLIGMYEMGKRPVYVIQDQKSRVYLIDEDGILGAELE